MIDADANVPDALAFHSEDNDRVDGYILCKTILENGGVPLYKDLTTPTIASALFHEVAEAIIDPTCNIWWQDNSGTMWAAEVADPVQGGIVPVVCVDLATKHAVTVGLSDFIYPAWRDTEAPHTAQFNYLRTLTAPFTIDKGGYAVICNGGQTQQVFGAEIPTWVRQLKSTTFRTTSRSKVGHFRKFHHNVHLHRGNKASTKKLEVPTFL
jgi:hypothetical protein